MYKEVKESKMRTTAMTRQGRRIAFLMRVGDTNFLWLCCFNLEHWRWNVEGSIVLGKLEAFEPAEPTRGRSQNEHVYKFCRKDIM